MAAGLSHDEIAALLQERAHRPIVADTYRKWEKAALLPHDLIIPFCELTGTEPYELLTGVPFSLAKRSPGPFRPKIVA